MNKPNSTKFDKEREVSSIPQLIAELERRINYAKNFGDGKSDVIISREKLIELNKEFLDFAKKQLEKEEAVLKVIDGADFGDSVDGYTELVYEVMKIFGVEEE